MWHIFQYNLDYFYLFVTIATISHLVENAGYIYHQYVRADFHSVFIFLYLFTFYSFISILILFFNAKKIRMPSWQVKVDQGTKKIMP